MCLELQNKDDQKSKYAVFQLFDYWKSEYIREVISVSGRLFTR